MVPGVTRCRTVAVLVAAAALLAGCSEEPQAQQLPPVTAAPSPTPTSAQLAVPELPAEAQGEDAVAATAFTEYFLRTVVVGAGQTNDPTVLRLLASPECGTCVNLIAAAEAQAEAGQRLEGTNYIIEGAAAPGTTGPEYVVDVRYRT